MRDALSRRLMNRSHPPLDSSKVRLRKKTAKNGRNFDGQDRSSMRDDDDDERRRSHLKKGRQVYRLKHPSHLHQKGFKARSSPAIMTAFMTIVSHDECLLTLTCNVSAEEDHVGPPLERK